MFHRVVPAISGLVATAASGAAFHLTAPVATIVSAIVGSAVGLTSMILQHRWRGKDTERAIEQARLTWELERQLEDKNSENPGT